MRILFLLLSLYLSSVSMADDPALPNWFKTTFMDFSEDLEETNNNNRHIVIYFHQDGCPYCDKLVRDNFHDKQLVAKLQKDFDVIEINMFSDRDLEDWTGKELNEKAFALQMQIQFTPTLVFLDAKGKTLLRLNGYQSIEKMHAALDYISNKIYLQQSYAHYINNLKKNKIGTLNPSSIFETGPHLLTRSKSMPAQKLLAVFFEEPNCTEYDFFHKNLLSLKRKTI